MSTSFTNGSALSRFGAKILDEFILLALLFPAMSLLGDSDITVLLIFIVPVLYHTYTHASRAQATPGEHIMQVYVVHTNGARLTLRQSFERALAYTLPTLPIYSSLEENTSVSIMFFLVIGWFLPILLTERATGIHDILCNSRVVAGRIV